MDHPTRHRLGYEHRLHRRSDYLKFFKRAVALKRGEALVFSIPNEHGHFRMGCTFKVRTNSVKRNRLKRRVREVFRELGPHLGGRDFNVVVRGQSCLDPQHQQKFLNDLIELLRGEVA